MSEEKAAPAESAPAAAPAASKLPLILSIVNTVATLAMVGVLVLSFKKEKTKPSVDDIVLKEHGEGEKAEGGHGEKADAHGGGGHGAAGGKKKGGEFGKMITLDQFTVNLATPGTVNPKFLRLAVTVEVPNDETENEVNAKMPQVRNAIIDLINSKRPADLASSEGRDYLKEEIKNALNAFMVTGKVRGVYFTNFAVTG